MATSASPSDPPLVLATVNRAKGRELAELLAGLPYRVQDLSEFPTVVLPPEGEESYIENALAKARTVTAATGLLALGDDSGIEVDALGGRPGVLSARYGGEGLSDPDRNALMLRELAGVVAARRTARYRAVIAVTAPDGREATVEGTVEGLITESPRGTGGFGYDPIFYYPPFGGTLAEVSPVAKHAVSHRARAMALARALLRRWAS
ncbi:MAG TPA: non-canonical purine NTP pyrophosphatase [Methylomirabilota bacterium]|nr:non-canonical purine NTP pyrophosphatase [Methylomirabilota bacterium]